MENRRLVFFALLVSLLLFACKSENKFPYILDVPSERDSSVSAEPIMAFKDSVEKFSKIYLNDPILGSDVKDALNSLPRCERIISEAYAISRGLQVDVILQSHKEDYLPTAVSEGLMSEVFESQISILNHLRKCKYDVIGDEGVDLDRVTMDSLCYLLRQGFIETGNIPPFRGELEKSIKENFPESAVNQFALENPERIVIGSEVKEINHLHFSVLSMLANLSVADLNLTMLSLYLKILRSELALAKLTLKLKEVNGSKGVIIIGGAHFPEMYYMIQDMGMVGTFMSSTVIENP